MGFGQHPVRSSSGHVLAPRAFRGGGSVLAAKAPFGLTPSEQWGLRFQGLGGVVGNKGLWYVGVPVPLKSILYLLKGDYM